RLFSRFWFDASCGWFVSSSFSRTRQERSNGRHPLRTRDQRVNSPSRRKTGVNSRADQQPRPPTDEGGGRPGAVVEHWGSTPTRVSHIRGDTDHETAALRLRRLPASENSPRCHRQDVNLNGI